MSKWFQSPLSQCPTKNQLPSPSPPTITSSWWVAQLLPGGSAPAPKAFTIPEPGAQRVMHPHTYQRVSCSAEEPTKECPAQKMDEETGQVQSGWEILVMILQCPWTWPPSLQWGPLAEGVRWCSKPLYSTCPCRFPMQLPHSLKAPSTIPPTLEGIYLKVTYKTPCIASILNPSHSSKGCWTQWTILANVSRQRWIG